MGESQAESLLADDDGNDNPSFDDEDGSLADCCEDWFGGGDSRLMMSECESGTFSVANQQRVL